MKNTYFRIMVESSRSAGFAAITVACIALVGLGCLHRIGGSGNIVVPLAEVVRGAIAVLLVYPVVVLLVA